MATVNYNYNFDESISRLVDEEVKRRIDNTVNECKRLRAELKEERAQNGSLQRELSILEKKLLDEQKHGVDRAKKELFGGYSVGDKCYIVGVHIVTNKCNRCVDGYIDTEVDGLKARIICPHCKYGDINITTYIPKEVVVRGIKYNTYRSFIYKPDEVDLNFDLTNSDYNRYFGLESMYKTLEECQEACDVKNKAGEALVL
ncbi:MAG: hypothetical protein PHF76_12415 [Bacteroidales bacterium]|nr:hypothetical protein [Bacteroidales bacterium]